MALIREGFPVYCAHFPGGDPRRYQPDEDGVTPEEQERWRAACEAADARRDLAEIDGAAVWHTEEDWSAIMHLTMFGPGIFWYESDLFAWEGDL